MKLRLCLCSFLDQWFEEIPLTFKFADKPSPGTYTRTSGTSSTNGTNRTSRTLQMGETKEEKGKPQVISHAQAPTPNKSQCRKKVALKDGFIHVQVHHGFHVCQWGPRSLEDQERLQHQQGQRCQGNHALPTKGKMKSEHHSGFYLMTFKFTERWKSILTLCPGWPSRPGGPSLPGLPCEDTMQVKAPGRMLPMPLCFGYSAFTPSAQ